MQDFYFRFPSVAQKHRLLKLSIPVQRNVGKNSCFKTSLIEYHFVWGNSNCYCVLGSFLRVDARMHRNEYRDEKEKC